MVAGLGHLVAHHDPLADLAGLAVDDLEELAAARRRRQRAGPVDRQVDPPDRRVVDRLLVLRDDVLVRRVARREAARPLPRGGVELVHDVAGRGRDVQARAVGADAHMVGAIAVDRRAPGDLLRRQVDGDDVGERGARDEDAPAVVRGEDVVVVLVVALADELPDPLVEALADRVERDLRLALGLVGDDVDAVQALERVGVDDVGRAVPVVADEDHRPRLARHRVRAEGAGVRGGGQERRDERGEEGGKTEAGHVCRSLGAGQRNVRQKARRSSSRRSGSSSAAKWPPRGIVVHRSIA